MAGLNTTGTIGAGMEGGRRRSGASVKTLKKMLKKAGLKVSGKKATLTRRAKKAHLKVKGGAGGIGEEEETGTSVLPEGNPFNDDKAAETSDGGRRRRRRGSRKMFGLI